MALSRADGALFAAGGVNLARDTSTSRDCIHNGTLEQLKKIESDLGAIVPGR